MRLRQIFAIVPLAAVVLLSAGCAATYQMHRGDTLMRTGKYHGAAKAYSESLKSEDSYEGHLRRGVALEKAGKTDLALKDYELALKISPQSENAGLYRAQLLLNEGKLEEALNAADMVAAENSQNIQAMALRGEIWFAGSDYQQALEDFEAGIKLAGNDDVVCLRLLHNRAVTLFKLKRFSEARRSYQDYTDKRMELGKGLRQEDYYNMGLFCYADYDYDAARKYWNKLPRRQRQRIAASIEEDSLKDLAQ